MAIFNFSSSHDLVTELTDDNNAEFATGQVGDVTMMALNDTGRCVEVFFLGPHKDCYELAIKMQKWSEAQESQELSAAVYLTTFTTHLTKQ